MVVVHGDSDILAKFIICWRVVEIMMTLTVADATDTLQLSLGD
jgi:hypothetical protein